jgi:hypothetical protein
MDKQYDPDSKQQSTQWVSSSSPRPKKKPFVSQSAVKVMVLFFRLS